MLVESCSVSPQHEVVCCCHGLPAICRGEENLGDSCRSLHLLHCHLDCCMPCLAGVLVMEPHNIKCCFTDCPAVVFLTPPKLLHQSLLVSVDLFCVPLPIHLDLQPGPPAPNLLPPQQPDVYCPKIPPKHLRFCTCNINPLPPVLLPPLQ